MSEFCKNERKRLDKLNRFQLHNRWKKIGYIFTGIAFALLFTRKLVTDAIWVQFAVFNMIIIGLLVISLSKEKIEDELIYKLRTQSYRLAFIFGVFFTLIQPYVNASVRLFKINVLNYDITQVGSNFSYFQILIFMLIIQIAFFEQFKRYA